MSGPQDLWDLTSLETNNSKQAGQVKLLISLPLPTFP
jgi:hypothetical protein